VSRQAFERASTRLQQISNYQQQKGLAKGETESRIKKIVTQNSNLQKSDLEKKLGNQSDERLQQKPPLPGGQPKTPQSAQDKYDQEKKKAGLGCSGIFTGLDESLNFRQPSATATKRCEDGLLNRQKDRETCARTTRPACAPNAY
jgi:hypothetical protein